MVNNWPTVILKLAFDRIIFQHYFDLHVDQRSFKGK